MAALDDAETGAAKQDQDSRSDAGAVRQIALDKSDQAVRGLFAQLRRLGADAI
jgi:hypothetical protein